MRLLKLYITFCEFVRVCITVFLVVRYISDEASYLTRQLSFVSKIVLMHQYDFSC